MLIDNFAVSKEFLDCLDKLGARVISAELDHCLNDDARVGVEVGGRRFESRLLGFRGGLGLFQCRLVLGDLRAFLRGVFSLYAGGIAS